MKDSLSTPSHACMLGSQHKDSAIPRRSHARSKRRTWRCVCAQTKEEIAHSVKEELTKSMTSFGFSIIQTLVTDIEPDLKVRAAMNEINAAQRLRRGRTPVHKSRPGHHHGKCKRAPTNHVSCTSQRDISW